jgi:hypothetical protein
MTNSVSTPPDYEPYGTVDLCGNFLQNVKFFFEVDGMIPVLIGKGVVPKIWLFQRDVEGKGVALIEKSISQSTDIFVNIDVDASEINVFFDNKVVKMHILSLTFSPSKIVIKKLDLQVVNLYIFGDRNGLDIAGNIVKGNRMSNVSTFIKIN